jgi:hypothetical protein
MIYWDTNIITLCDIHAIWYVPIWNNILRHINIITLCYIYVTWYLPIWNDILRHKYNYTLLCPCNLICSNMKQYTETHKYNYTLLYPCNLIFSDTIYIYNIVCNKHRDMSNIFNTLYHVFSVVILRATCSIYRIYVIYFAIF